ELDADDGVEDVVGVRPGVDGPLPAAALRLAPDRLGPDRPEVDPQRRLGLALGKGENPIPDVGFGVPLAQMGVEIDGEDVPVGASDPAPETDRSAAGAEVDLGVERLDPGHERPQDSRGPKLTVKALPCQSVQSFAGSGSSSYRDPGCPQVYEDTGRWEWRSRACARLEDPPESPRPGGLLRPRQRRDGGGGRLHPPRHLEHRRGGRLRTAEP